MTTQFGEAEPEKQPLLYRIDPAHLFWAMLGVTICGLVVGTCLLYQDEGTMPQPTPPPPLPEKAALADYRYKETFYHSVVDEDLKQFGLAKDDYPALRQGNRYFSEFSGKQRLKFSGTLDTAHLKLQAQRGKYWVGEEGQGYRTEHLSLRITNKTNKHLAYRIITDVKGRCSGKGIIPHNALALKPKETIVRTECLVRDTDDGLNVLNVEVLEISPIGYYYISRLDPPRLWFDERTAEGHNNARQLPCKVTPWRIFQAAHDSKQAQWFDVFDFYSRHNCDEYTFYLGYRWNENAPATLPVKPPSKS